MAMAPVIYGGKTNNTSLLPSRPISRGEKAARSFHNVCDVVVATAEKVALTVQRLRCNRNAFENISNICLIIFKAVELGYKELGSFASVAPLLGRMNSIIDQFQILETIRYWASLEFLKDTPLNIAAEICWSAASIGGAALFLGDVGLLNLGKIGAAIGKVPVLGSVTRLGVSFGTCVTGLVGVGFVFMGGNAVWKLISKNTPTDDKCQAKWDLAWCVAEVGLKTFIIIGAMVPAVAASPATPFILLPLGAVAAGLGIAAYLHRV